MEINGMIFSGSYDRLLQSLLNMAICYLLTVRLV